jgi:hypothetical protein
MSEEHYPEVIYFDEYHTETPAEVCMACSDPENGIWVPASFCEISREIMNTDA